MRIDHVCFRTSNPEKSVSFYKKYFGLKECDVDPHHKEGYIATFLMDEESQVMLELIHDLDGRQYDYGNSFGHLSFRTENAEELTREIGLAGYPAKGKIHPTHSGKIYYIGTVMGPDKVEITLVNKLFDPKLGRTNV